MLLSNFLKIGFRPAKTAAVSLKRPDTAAAPHGDFDLAQKFKDLPLQGHVEAGTQTAPTSSTGAIQLDEQRIEAIVCDPLSGGLLGRVRLLHPVGQSGMYSFELIEGQLKRAWLTRQTLHLRLPDGAVRSANLAGYPADGCQTGLISLE